MARQKRPRYQTNCEVEQDDQVDVLTRAENFSGLHFVGDM